MLYYISKASTHAICTSGPFLTRVRIKILRRCCCLLEPSGDMIDLLTYTTRDFSGSRIVKKEFKWLNKSNSLRF